MTQLIGIVQNGQITIINNSYYLSEGAKFVLTPLINDQEIEENDWNNLAFEGLNNAYDNDEPEYSLNQIKEFNSEYEAR